MRVLNLVLADYVTAHLIDGMIDLRLMIAVMPYSMYGTAHDYGVCSSAENSGDRGLDGWM